MKVSIYTFRSECEISGERKSTLFLESYLRSKYIFVDQKEYCSSKSSSFWSFFSVSKYLTLLKLSKSNFVDVLIIKIPTASQVFLIPLLVKGFRGKVVVWLDGLMWEFPGVKASWLLFKKEPLVLLARMILNSNILSAVAYFFPLTYVASSKTQKQQFSRYLHPRSKFHIIPNAVSYADDFSSHYKLSDDKIGVKFGYIGHAYPVKGLSDIKKSFEMLHELNIAPSLNMALSGRGSLAQGELMALPNVLYEGLVDRMVFYSKVDCLIFPYLADWGTNTFPSVLLESMELGVPVIIPESKLSIELFGKDGALFYERGNYVELANIVKQVYRGDMQLPSRSFLRALYKDRFRREDILKKWSLLLSVAASADIDD